MPTAVKADAVLAVIDHSSLKRFTSKHANFHTILKTAWKDVKYIYIYILNLGIFVGFFLL